MNAKKMIERVCKGDSAANVVGEAIVSSRPMPLRASQMRGSRMQFRAGQSSAPSSGRPTTMGRELLKGAAYGVRGTGRMVGGLGLLGTAFGGTVGSAVMLAGGDPLSPIAGAAGGAKRGARLGLSTAGQIPGAAVGRAIAYRRGWDPRKTRQAQAIGALVGGGLSAVGTHLVGSRIAARRWRA